MLCPVLWLCFTYQVKHSPHWIITCKYNHIDIQQWDVKHHPCDLAKSPMMSGRVHNSDVKMDAMASQITSLTIVYSTVYSDANQRKHQNSASLAFVRGLHGGPVNSPHKWPVTRPSTTDLWYDHDIGSLYSALLTLCAESLTNCPHNRVKNTYIWCLLSCKPGTHCRVTDGLIQWRKCDVTVMIERCEFAKLEETPIRPWPPFTNMD